MTHMVSPLFHLFLDFIYLCYHITFTRHLKANTVLKSLTPIETKAVEGEEQASGE